MCCLNNVGENPPHTHTMSNMLTVCSIVESYYVLSPRCVLFGILMQQLVPDTGNVFEEVREGERSVSVEVVTHNSIGASTTRGRE